MAAEQWYWCLRHQRAEPEPTCPARDRLGPYASAAEAADHAERTEARDEHWEEQDRRWSEQ